MKKKCGDDVLCRTRCCDPCVDKRQCGGKCTLHAGKQGICINPDFRLKKMEARFFEDKSPFYEGT